MLVESVKDLPVGSLVHATQFIPDIQIAETPQLCTQYHFVYCIINVVNFKFYVGKHSTNNIHDGYMSSSPHVHKAISKHGVGNFRKIIIKYLATEQEAYEYESKLITQEMINSNLCYNRGGGGCGFSSGATNPSVVRVLDGSHPWLGSNWNLTKVKNGTHPLATRPDGTSFQSDLVKAGKHIFQRRPDGTSLQTDLVKAGKHTLQKRPDGTSVASDLVQAGKHHLLRRSDGTSVTSDRYAAGTHPFQTGDYCVNKHALPWNMTHSTEHSKLTWWHADVVYEQHILFPDFGKCKLTKVCNKVLGVDLNVSSVYSIVSKFKDGWVPLEDVNWKQFKDSALP